MTGLPGWIADRLHAGGPVTLATLVRVDGSAPLAAGAMLAVTDGGRFRGSVAGGCVDATVLELADRGVDGPQWHRFAADDGPGAVGPVCGGRLTVLVEPLSGPDDHDRWRKLADAVAAGRPTERTMITTAPDVGRNADIAVDTRKAAALGSPVVHLEPRGDHATVSWLWPAPPRLIIVGADAIAVELSRLATGAGWSVSVIDPRPTFTRPDRWETGVEVHTGWPQHWIADATTMIDSTSAVCVLTHDERVELPSLLAALASRAGFVGALGSRATDRRRRERLRAEGVGEQRIRDVRGPLGLDLGGRDPASIALSIAAHLQSWRYGGSGAPLSG